jgi:DUF1009 family protein
VTNVAAGAHVRPVGPLGILALGGRMPVAVAQTVVQRGRDVFIIGLRGAAHEDIGAFPHDWIAPFEIGRLVRLLRQRNCADIVFAGTMLRPRIASVRFDLGTLRLVPLLMASRGSGDDALLRRVTLAAEQHGFRVLGLADVAPELIAPDGDLTRAGVDVSSTDDAQRGFALLDALGPHDVGQACVVHRGRVLAVEAAEGTTAMVRRIADLRASGRLTTEGRAGVLVKAPKPQQELRNDMPVLGAETVAAAVDAKLAGIVWRAGSVLLLDAPEMIRRADAAGMFLAGLGRAERRP